MTKKPLKIAHFNFGHNTNKGDSAIILSIQDILKETLGKDLVIDSFPIQHLVYRTYISFSQTFFDKIKATKNTFLVLIFRIILLPFALLAFLKDLIMVFKVNQCDLVVIGGGGVYSPRWTLPFKDNIINLFRPKIVIFAAGYGQSKKDLDLNKKQIKSLDNLHQKASLHSVRDKNTYDLFQSINKKYQPEIIIDPAIKLASRKVEKIHFDKNKFKIGVNLAYHDWTGQSTYLNTMINSYSQTLNNLIQKKPEIELYYMVHSSFEYIHEGKKTSEFDAINLLQEKLNKKMIVCDYPARELKYIYENLDFSICMMLHSSILAFGSTIPFVSIGYDQKNRAFMEFIKMEEAFIDVSELNSHNMEQKIEYLISNLNQRKDDLLRKKAELEKKLDDFVSSIKTLVV
jgi:polysaccharide pyruvyl transferase WcaK-like protein